MPITGEYVALPLRVVHLSRTLASTFCKYLSCSIGSSLWRHIDQHAIVQRVRHCSGRKLTSFCMVGGGFSMQSMSRLHLGLYSGLYVFVLGASDGGRRQRCCWFRLLVQTFISHPLCVTLCVEPPTKCARFLGEVRSRFCRLPGRRPGAGCGVEPPRAPAA